MAVGKTLRWRKLVSFLLVNLLGTLADIVVVDLDSNRTAAVFSDMPAGFGDDFPKQGIKGRIVMANPPQACTPIKEAPLPIDDYPYIVLIARGGCQFTDKVLNAQKANYCSAVVHNYENRQGLRKMGGDSSEITIPSTFVGFNSGRDLQMLYSYPRYKDFVVNIREIEEIDYRMYLWPFAIVVGVCFLMIVLFLVIKFVRDHTRSRVARLSRKHLKKIPIRKYKKGQYYDTCAVCLDEYEEGEKIRVLPCDHAYHAKCIDPWLTKNKKTCPVCKRRVIPGKDPNSSSDSDSDGEDGTSQTTPLLMNATSQRSHGSTGQTDAEIPQRQPRARSAPALFDSVSLETEDAVGGGEVTPSTSQAGAAGESSNDRGEQRETRRKRKERRREEEGGESRRSRRERRREEEGGESRRESVDSGSSSRLLLAEGLQHEEEDEEDLEERRKADRRDKKKKKKDRKSKSKSVKRKEDSVREEVGGQRDGEGEDGRISRVLVQANVEPALVGATAAEDWGVHVVEGEAGSVNGHSEFDHRLTDSSGEVYVPPPISSQQQRRGKRQSRTSEVV